MARESPPPQKLSFEKWKSFPSKKRIGSYVNDPEVIRAVRSAPTLQSRRARIGAEEGLLRGCSFSPSKAPSCNDGFEPLPAHSARHSGLESFSLVLRDSTRRMAGTHLRYARAHRRTLALEVPAPWPQRVERSVPGLVTSSKFGPVVRLQLIALACEPMESKNGVSRRTIEQLRQVSISQGIVEGISWSSVQRILAQAELRPHLVRGWMHSPDPEFREKVTEITELYSNPPPGEVVLCVDEKTGMQALERRFADRPPAPRRARRREFEYKRHGTQSLFCAFDVHTGRVVESCDVSFEGRKTSSALWKQSLPTTPKAKCTSSGIISISTTTDPWLAGAISIVATAIASSCPLHSKTRLMGQPGGVVFQHFTKAMLARRQLLLSRRASGRSARVHRLLEPRKGPSLPVDFHRLSATIWHRVRKSFLKMSYENPQALLDEQTYRPTSPAAV